MAERSYQATEANLWASIKREALSATYDKDEIWNLFQKFIKTLTQDTVTLEGKVAEITPREFAPEERKRREQRKEAERGKKGRVTRVTIEGGRK